MAAGDLTASQGSSMSSVPRDFQKQYERDLHLMLDDLDLPNQSLTVSQMSTNQWQGKSMRSYTSNLKSQSGIGQTQSSVESSQLQSARHSNLTISNSIPSAENTDEKKFQHHEDSPDFNRREDLVSVTDDLTVSHTDMTDYDAGGKSQRGTMHPPQNFDPVLRNQNRTFADSVLDHQINVLTQNHKTKTANKRAGTHTRLDSKSGQSPNEGISSREFQISADSRSRNLQPDELASSGLTDFDLLTRTQISNNLMVIDPSARSRIFIPSDDSHLSQSQITADQPLTRRTNGTNNNIFRRMLDDASSLNFTPDQLEDDIHSQSIDQSQSNSNSQQNSHFHSRTNSLTQQHYRHYGSNQREIEQQSEQLSQRDSGSKANPINQLKQKIMQQNQQMRHKKGDLELEQALETPPVAKHYTSSTQHQRQVNELTAQNTELLAQVCQLTIKCDSFRQKESLQKPGGSELLKARALEAARSEIRELREQCQEQEDTIKKMSDGHRSFEKEKIQLLEKTRALEVLLDKQKIIMQSQKREMDAQVKALTNRAHDASADQDQVKSQCDQKLLQMQAQCKTLEQRFRQCEEYVQLRDVEIQEVQKDLKFKCNEATKLESQCYALQQEVKNYKIKSQELESTLEQREPQTKQTVTGFDNELRRINETHQQQLQKLKEENHSLKTKVRDFETKVKVSDMREQSTLIPQLATLLNVPQSMLLDTVNSISESKKIFEDELKIAQELTTQKELLNQQQQQQILQLKQETQLAREAAQKAQQVVASQESGPSMFTKNLIYQKDIELQNQRDKISSLQEQNWQLEQEVKVKQMQIQNLNSVEAEMDRQITNLRQVKDRSDQNVTELKDKLRSVLQKQDERNLQYSSAKSSVAESVDRQKYEDLVTMVLSLDLASDPLNGFVQTLQESFIDEFEQAQTHLQEQQKLVKSRLAAQQSTINRLTQSNDSANEQVIKNQKEASRLLSRVNELQIENQTLEDFSKRQSQVVQQLESQVLSRNLSTDKMLAVLDQVIKKDYSYCDQELVSQVRDRIESMSSQFGMSQIPILKERNFAPDKSMNIQSALLLEELSHHMVDSSCQTVESQQDQQLARLLQQSQQTLQLREQQLIEATQIIEELQETQSERGSKIEMLKQQVMTELQLKSDELEIETEHVEAQRMEMMARIKQLEVEFSERVGLLEQQYQEKLVKSDFSKQEALQMKKQLELKQNEIDQLLEKSVQTPRTSQTDQQLKVEIKRWKEEIERLKKSYADKEAGNKQEFEKQKATLEQLMQDQISEVHAVSKKERKEAIEKAVDKVKVELLNRITELKNEQAKREAEWQRQQNKFNQAKEEAIENALQVQEQQRLDDLKEAKLHVQQIWKKKLEDRSKQADETVRERDLEIQELTVRIQAQATKNQQEVTKMRQKVISEYEEKRAVDMPRQVEVEVQVSQNYLKLNTSPMSSRVLQASPNQTCSCMCSNMQAEGQEQQEQYIEQLKVNFELELERQDKAFKHERAQLKKSAFKVFETIVSLECDKILETISFKSQSKSFEMLNTRRTEINDLIKDLVNKNDGGDRQLKKSFEALKLKITTVLSQLKQQIQAKNTVVKTIEVQETISESTTKRLHSARQSTSSEVNLTMNQSITKSPPVPEARPNSDLKQYSELIDDQSEDESALMKRLQPQTVNSKGAIVVEVDKVVRDLSILYETVRMSKFFTILGCQPLSLPTKSQDFDRSRVVEKYRELLNDFFKMINKLNHAVDQMGEHQEAFKLRLANIDLKQQLSQFKQEQTQQVTRQIIQHIIGKYSSPHSPKQVQQKVGFLEQLHFQISKDQFKLNQIADLFIKNGNVNQDSNEVLQKCMCFNQCEEFLESSFKTKYFSPEMLSPDETAHLIANVIQKLPGQNLSQSSEEVLTKALRICHDSSVTMPPLQRPPKATLRMNTARGNNMPQPSINTMHTTTEVNQIQRSRSTGMQPGMAAYNMPQQVHGSSIYQTLDPQTKFHLQSESTSGIVVSNNSQQRSGVNDRYTAFSGQGHKGQHATLSTNTDFLVEDNDESILIHNKNLDEELQNAQTNVNHLFKKLKGSRFNTLQH